MADPLRKKDYTEPDPGKEKDTGTTNDRSVAYDGVYCYVKLGDVRIGKIHIDRIKLRRRHHRARDLEEQASGGDAPEDLAQDPQPMHLVAEDLEPEAAPGDADAELHGVTLEDVEVGTIFLQKPKDGDPQSGGGS